MKSTPPTMMMMEHAIHTMFFHHVHCFNISEIPHLIWHCYLGIFNKIWITEFGLVYFVQGKNMMKLTENRRKEIIKWIHFITADGIWCCFVKSLEFSWDFIIQIRPNIWNRLNGIEFSFDWHRELKCQRNSANFIFSLSKVCWMEFMVKFIFCKLKSVQIRYRANETYAPTLAETTSLVGFQLAARCHVDSVIIFFGIHNLLFLSIRKHLNSIKPCEHFK